MSKQIMFVVNGEPMAKQRPRATTYGKIARVYTPKDTINYENKVLSCYKDRCKELSVDTEIPLFDRSEILEVGISAYFPLRQSDFGKKGLNKSGREKIEKKYCPSHKDCDNIAKIILDGLNGIAYLDDKQVVRLSVEKIWSIDNPRVVVQLISV